MSNATASAMESAAANGQVRPVAVVHGGALMVPTLLGRAVPRIPVAGRIRAGIKVLSKRAAGEPRACEIYERGLREGQSFDRIEQALETRPGRRFSRILDHLRRRSSRASLPARAQRRERNPLGGFDQLFDAFSFSTLATSPPLSRFSN